VNVSIQPTADIIMTTSLLEYYEAIEAPLKRFFYIEKSSHAAMVEQPEEFARILIEEIRPLAFAGSAGSSE